MKKFLFLFILAFGFQQLNAQLAVTISHTNVSCNGGCNGTATANPSGGTPPYAYVWNPSGVTTQMASGLCAGNYTVTVTDALSATASATVAIIQPAPLTISLSTTPTSTCSGSDGAIYATINGGTAPYTYTCNPLGPISIPEYNVVAGNYTVTVTDAQGCTASGTTTVGQPPAMSLSFSTTTINCNGGTGNITATVFGGTAPFTYNWLPGNMTTPTITNVTAGAYTLTVTDAAGCSQTGVAVITQPAPVPVTITPGTATICSGSPVTLTGSGAIVYSWAPTLQTTSTITVSPTIGQSYTLTGTDANGCNGFAVINISVNQPPTVNLVSSIESTCSGANGSATVAASGNSPFTYNWLPAGGTNATSCSCLISVNTFTVDVTDANGCVTSLPVSIGDSCNFVWPGDANDDAVADNNDILDIGIANGATGTTRANATLNWIGQPSNPWGQTLLSGTDYKWVDCNGDGVIDPADTNAVIQNFGLTHNNRFGGIPVYDATLPDLTITMGQSVLASNSPGTLTVGFGSSSVPVSNFYGLAFTLNFDATQIDASTFRMNETGTWMGIPGTDMMGVVMNSGTGTGSVEIAMTRLDHINANGFGTIANVGFMTTGNLVGTGNTQNVNFTISNVTVISANETPQSVNAVNDSVVVEDPILLGVNENKTNSVSAYPNPFDQSVQIILPESAKGKACVVTLTDASGRVVLTQQTGNAKSMIIQRGTLEAGIYFCTIRSEGQMIGNTKLIVK